MENKIIKILIIEDESMTALHLKQIINSAQYEVVRIVNCAADALDYLEQHHVDLALADINIHGDKTGLDVAEEIQSQYAMPIIFITAQQDDASLRQASRIEHSGYIVKPFSSDDVLTTVKLAVLKYDLDRYSEELGNGYQFIYDQSKLLRNNEEIELTNKERELLRLLVKSKNAVCSNAVIDVALWNDKFVTDAVRRNLVFKLKQKIPELSIITHKGIGYQLQTSQGENE
jgi:DNA-binding response OmpR family regulator